MDSAEIRKRFLQFFKDRGHIVVPSSPLVTDDPSVLFTTAGMQQFKPYYTGDRDAEADFKSKNTVSVQKCVRTSDIDEVGDESHLTFFEMLGNFSFGGYWKKEAIQYAYDFITKELQLTIDYVSVFEGDAETPADQESRDIWKKISPNLIIKNHNRADNFWGPTGNEGPCGPTTEIYINGVEIWNIVFNEYFKTKDGKYTPLETKGIDTGMGLERLLVQVQGKDNIFDTDLFETILPIARRLSADQKSQRIIADHFRTAVFMIADDVLPSNSERGYVLRRLLRKAISATGNKKIDNGDISVLVNSVVDKYGPIYKNLQNSGVIKQVIEEENINYNRNLEHAMPILVKELKKIEGPITGQTIFGMSSTLGVKVDEVISMADRLNLITSKTWGEELKEAKTAHQEISRAGAEQKFKGGLADTSEMSVKYHTATHLLHQALHDVLGDEVGQKGSNITPERLRFDFAFPRKLTEEEKGRVEETVNAKIAEALPVNKVIMPKEEAEKTGARHFFDQKYPDEVSVYYIGPDLEHAYSKEFCGGPHVANISELGHFKIIKEEAVSTGVRRIKAVLE